MIPRSLQVLGVTLLCVAPTPAQHSQVSSVAVDPNNSNRVWVCNRDNNSVSRVDLAVSPPQVIEIEVGIKPRSIAITPDGSTVLVANQRGNVPLDANFVTGFPSPYFPGTVSVIDTSSMSVSTTLTDVGVEPYGLALAPGGEWFVVSGFRSGTLRVFETATLTELFTFQYPHNLNQLPAGVTIADADADQDGIADTGDPRGFVIREDGLRLYVTHNKSSWVSVLDVTPGTGGLPSGFTLAAKIDTNDYPFHPIFNPVPVQTVESQGIPRFTEDITLSPDGSRALVPHLLHNVNHDVNHDFGPGFVGAALNRVYPALTTIDAAALSYGQPGDASARLHHEHTDEATPGEFAAFGEVGETSNGERVVLGATGSPLLGQPIQFRLTGLEPGDSATLLLGSTLSNTPFGTGTLLIKPRRMLPISSGTASLVIPTSAASLVDFIAYAQAYVDVAGAGNELVPSNALKFRIENTGLETGKMGHRAGHPSRVLYNEGGDHVLMLNRGSEDVFLYEASGSDLRLRAVFPERLEFQERAALDTTTPMGDLPLGWAMVPDIKTDADDVLLHIINEGTRTLSVLRVNFETGTIHQEFSQIDTVLTADEFSLSVRIGQELFEDASRPQTTASFNNSCASCHFEGGEDGNVWQRPAGPRSTMPVYGGTLGTGLLLWKGTRLGMGETGPMFGGENGGDGIFSQAEQKGLNDYHEVIPSPLNPNLEHGTGDLTPLAQLGKDLFFGTNDTGMNLTGRDAGCANCHSDTAIVGGQTEMRFYTVDHVNELLEENQALGILDPDCFSLRENIVSNGVRNVNTGVNVDEDGDGQPDADRNLDGYVDIETYTPMNIDLDDDFTRDDPNSYDCPCTPGSFGCTPDGTREFTRNKRNFSVPTKMGVFATAPYFHDHVPYSLRTMLSPSDQALDPQYGQPAYGGGGFVYPGLNKVFNEEHDVIGHEDLGGISDVQLTLQSGSPAQARADMEAILAFIESL